MIMKIYYTDMAGTREINIEDAVRITLSCDNDGKTVGMIGLLIKNLIRLGLLDTFAVSEILNNKFDVRD